MNYIVTSEIVFYGIFTFEQAVEKINYLANIGIAAKVGKLA